MSKATLTWRSSYQSLFSPSELQGPGIPLDLSFSAWHYNTKAIRADVSFHVAQNLVWMVPVWMRWGLVSYMISVSSQWELAGTSSTFAMYRPMGLLSVWMQRQCNSTPKPLRLLRLLPMWRKGLHMVTKCIELLVHGSQDEREMSMLNKRRLTFTASKEGQDNHDREGNNCVALHFAFCFD